MMRLGSIALAIAVAAAFASCRENEPETVAQAPAPPASAELRATVTLSPEHPVARQAATLSIELQQTSGGVPQLEPIAGSEVHLVAVNRDLSWYEHRHPRPDGSKWKAEMTFPSGGEYVLHTIFRPKSGAQIVRERIVRVSGPEGAARALEVSPRERRSDNYTVHLRTDPEPPAAGVWNSLTFRIERDGAPVTNLVPTGALGHIVIVRDGGEDFVYAHSTDGEAVSGIRARAHVPAVPGSIDSDHSRHVGDTGPEVTFHTRFPRLGKYRMWVEFRAGEERIDADYVVDVGPAPPPLEHKH